MKTKIIIAFLFVGMLGTGFAAAQPQEDLDTNQSEDVEIGLETVVDRLDSIQSQLQDIQERLDRIEADLAEDPEAPDEANGESESENNGSDQAETGQPETPNGEENLGQNVSEHAQNQDRQGIFGAISNFLGDRNERAQENFEDRAGNGETESEAESVEPEGSGQAPEGPDQAQGQNGPN